MLDGTLIWFEHGLNGLTRTVLLQNKNPKNRCYPCSIRKKFVFNIDCFCLNNSVSIL